jgi:hypothetical protein
MARTPKQDKAIQHQIEKGFRPEMSVYPMYSFTNKETGERVTHSISTLVDWMDADKKAAARQKREEAKAAKANANQRERTR